MKEDDLLGRAVAFAVAVLGSLGFVVWGGAWLAAYVTGGSFGAGIGDAVVAAFRLPGQLANPAGAWPDGSAGGLPGPLIYWPATLVVAAIAAGFAGAGLSVWQKMQRAGTADRERLGVNARAWLARPRDLATLIVPGPQRGRFILGRFRGQLIASECRATREQGSSAAVRNRQGDTGAVALIGPSRSGKTVAAVAGILEWEGPAILSSVKTDLMTSTIGWRAQRGEIRIYDPLALTPYAGNGWSPLGESRSLTGARSAARNQLEALADDGTDNLGMWKNLAEYLMAGLFWTAANSGRDMATVMGWVLTQDRPQPDVPSELDDLLRELLGSPDPEVADAATIALDWLLSTWKQDERPRSSIYVTAQASLSAFSDPAVSNAAATNEIDLEWLFSGENTLYIAAPLKDRTRLAPAFGGLLNDLFNQIYQRGDEAPKDRLLFILDEAGNQRLDQLPEYASTVAGYGVQLVTIWQSVAQITKAYDRASGTVLTNHLSKLFFSGLSDQDSLEYVSRVVGEEEVESRQLSGHWSALTRNHVMEQTNRVGLAQPHCMRQMLPGDALLLHATLPPAHVRARNWLEEPTLRSRAEQAPPNHLQPRDGTPEHHPSARPTPRWEDGLDGELLLSASVSDGPPS